MGITVKIIDKKEWPGGYEIHYQKFLNGELVAPLEKVAFSRSTPVEEGKRLIKGYVEAMAAEEAMDVPDWSSEMGQEFALTDLAPTPILTLAEAQTAKQAKLDLDLNTYLAVKPDGRPRYPVQQLIAMLASRMEATDQLAKNPAQAKVDDLTSRDKKIKDVWSWINTVFTHYGQARYMIYAAQTTGALTEVAWDFSQFDATDPDVTTPEIWVATEEA